MIRSICRVVILFLISFLAACSVNHQGLLREHHRLEPAGEPLVHVVLRRIGAFTFERHGDESRVFGSGEGELRSIVMTLRNEPHELNMMGGVGIQGLFNGPNPTLTNCDTYEIIRANDEVFIRDWNFRNNNLSQGATWIRARRNSRIEFVLEVKELDCSGCNLCDRGDSGKLSIEMTLPLLPAVVPASCEGPDALIFEFGNLDGQPTFFGFRDTVSTFSGDMRALPSNGIGTVAGEICIHAADI